MKKIVFGIALIMFGLCMGYFSVLSDWGIMQLASLLSAVIGLVFSIFGFIEKER